LPQDPVSRFLGGGLGPFIELIPRSIFDLTVTTTLPVIRLFLLLRSKKVLDTLLEITILRPRVVLLLCKVPAHLQVGVSAYVQLGMTLCLGPGGGSKKNLITTSALLSNPPTTQAGTLMPRIFLNTRVRVLKHSTRLHENPFRYRYVPVRCAGPFLRLWLTKNRTCTGTFASGRNARLVNQ